MKNLKIYIFSILILSSFSSLDSSVVWGEIGHKVVGEIAERKLNPNVKLIINELLDGESMANASTWADEIKSDPLYKQYSPWHYVNMPLDKEYSDIKKNEKGDIVSTLKKHIIEHLKKDYIELSNELMSMNEVDFSLNPDDWVYETHQDVKILYAEIEKSNVIDNKYINNKIPFIKHKLFKAGSTLAGVLNDIFS